MSNLLTREHAGLERFWLVLLKILGVVVKSPRKIGFDVQHFPACLTDEPRKTAPGERDFNCCTVGTSGFYGPDIYAADYHEKYILAW